MKRFLSLLLVVTIVLICLVSCKKYNEENEVLPTDEELITARIETFLTAYNTGDMEAVLECLDAKTRNAFQATWNLLGGLAGAAAGFDINLSDLFSLGVNTTQGDFMELEITDIEVIDSSNATATTIMILAGAEPQTVYFKMVYENDGWYIHDMTDKKPINTIPTDENSVVPTKIDTFVDGVAKISYSIDGVDYNGIINADGEIIYSTDKTVDFTVIGKSSTIVSELNKDTYEYIPACIVDGTGRVVKTFDDKTQIAAYGDGLALIYQRKETISAIEHLYGIIDFAGNWVQAMTNLETYNNEEHYYAGDGIFAIAVWTGYYHNDYLFWNGNNGNMFYVSGLEVPPNFKNEVAFVYDTSYSRIINPFDISNLNEDEEGVATPDYFLLYSDGTFKEVDMENKELRGCSNGYIYYNAEDDENVTYIIDISSSNQSTFTYYEYPASMINSIDFVGDYGLVTINGANGNLYFTLIDKNGNQKFEPIETESYNGWSGTHSIIFSDDVIIFKNTEEKYCIANTTGDIIVTEYDYIYAFTDGVAAACIDEGGMYSEKTWVYINKNNEQVIKTVKLS